MSVFMQYSRSDSSMSPFLAVAGFVVAHADFLSAGGSTARGVVHPAVLLPRTVGLRGAPAWRWDAWPAVQQPTAVLDTERVHPAEPAAGTQPGPWAETVAPTPPTDARRAGMKAGEQVSLCVSFWFSEKMQAESCFFRFARASMESGLRG